MWTHHIFQAIYGTFPELHVIFCQCPCLVCEHILDLIKRNVEYEMFQILQFNHTLKTPLIYLLLMDCKQNYFEMKKNHFMYRCKFGVVIPMLGWYRISCHDLSVLKQWLAVCKDCKY